MCLYKVKADMGFNRFGRRVKQVFSVHAKEVRECYEASLAKLQTKYPEQFDGTRIKIKFLQLSQK